MGLDGFGWVSWGFTGFQRVLLVFIGLTGFGWVEMGFYWFDWVWMG